MGPGTFRATGINDLGQVIANACLPDVLAAPYSRCTAYRLDPVADPPAVVEFYNASLGHYFMTHVLSEIALLDQGTEIRGWVRTGQSFNVFVSVSAHTSPVCRVYIPPALGDSHFYGRSRAECDATLLNHPTFVTEDGDFFRALLPANGNCMVGTIPVYRLFNNRPDANHRYTTDRTVRDAMLEQGWVAEGDGADGIAMCVPE
jgi:hypothetical protein